MRPPFFARVPLVAALALTLGGCATLNEDRGFAAVESGVAAHIEQKPAWSRDAATRALLDQRVEALLAQPLSIEAAVEVALLNNPGLQAAYHELGLADAARVKSGRLPNPGFSIGRLTRGDEIEWERSLHLNLAALLLLPKVHEIETRRFEATRQRLVLDTLRRVADTRRAWIEAVAAEAGVRYQRQVFESAEAGAELARRMQQVGNWSALQRAREHRFYADAALALARAEQKRIVTREALARQLGLADPARLMLPERLPEVPVVLPAFAERAQAALDTRLDLAAARHDLDALAQNLALTRTTRVFNVLELGLMHNRSNEAPIQRGLELSFELPVFDFGSARVAQAEAVYGQAVERLREAVVKAYSEIRTAHALRASQHAIARHYLDEVLPLQQRISEETLLRYNGMLVGVFDLLADARAQTQTVQAALEAQRDYWLAETDWFMARLGSPGAAPVRAASPATAPADTGGGH